MMYIYIYICLQYTYNYILPCFVQYSLMNSRVNIVYLTLFDAYSIVVDCALKSVSLCRPWQSVHDAFGKAAWMMRMRMRCLDDQFDQTRDVCEEISPVWLFTFFTVCHVWTRGVLPHAAYAVIRLWSLWPTEQIRSNFRIHDVLTGCPSLQHIGSTLGNAWEALCCSHS